jgi:hypothetical protein
MNDTIYKVSKIDSKVDDELDNILKTKVSREDLHNFEMLSNHRLEHDNSKVRAFSSNDKRT